MYWELELNFNNGQMWVCDLKIEHIISLLTTDDKNESGIQAFADIGNEWVRMWSQIFQEEMKFAWDAVKKENYLKMKSHTFKL